MKEEINFINDFKNDLFNLINTFLNKKSFDFGSFKEIWRTQSFSLCHFIKTSKKIRYENYVQILYKIALGFFFQFPFTLPNSHKPENIFHQEISSFISNIAVLYSLYCIYHTVLPFSEQSQFIPIRISPNDLKLLYFVAEGFRFLGPIGLKPISLMKLMFQNSSSSYFELSYYSGPQSLYFMKTSIKKAEYESYLINHYQDVIEKLTQRNEIEPGLVHELTSQFDEEGHLSEASSLLAKDINREDFMLSSTEVDAQNIEEKLKINILPRRVEKERKKEQIILALERKKTKRDYQLREKFFGFEAKKNSSKRNRLTSPNFLGVEKRSRRQRRMFEERNLAATQVSISDAYHESLSEVTDEGRMSSELPQYRPEEASSQNKLHSNDEPNDNPVANEEESSSGFREEIEEEGQEDHQDSLFEDFQMLLGIKKGITEEPKSSDISISELQLKGPDLPPTSTGTIIASQNEGPDDSHDPLQLSMRLLSQLEHETEDILKYS